MMGHGVEVLVRRQEVQTVTDGQSGEKGVDRSNLHSAPPTVVAERRCLDVIFNLGDDDRKKRELLDSLLSKLVSRAEEPTHRNG